MEIVDASKESTNGLELDKIDLSDILFAPGTEKKAQKKGKKFGIKIPSLNKANFKIVLIIGAMILSLTIVYLLWDQKIIDLPFIESGSTAQMSKRIATVGPVMASFGKDDHIKMTVQIECKDTKLKDKVLKLFPHQSDEGSEYGTNKRYKVNGFSYVCASCRGQKELALIH